MTEERILRVLLMEDSADDALLIERELRRGGFRLQLERIETEPQLRRALAEAWDVCIVDHGLPAYSGMAALRLIAAEGSGTPVIMISGVQGEEFAVEAMRAGAQDYVSKNRLMRLVPAIRRELDEAEAQRRAAAEKERAESALRESELRLRESEAQYRLLFDNMNEAVVIDEIVRDQAGRAVDWVLIDANPAFETVLGFARRDALGQRASRVYGSGAEFAAILQVYAQVAESGAPAQLEIPFSRTGRSLLVSVFALGGDRFATVAMDITERKRAETEREKALAELEATIAAIADGVVVYGRGAEILRMNPAAEKLLAYPPEIRRLAMPDRLAYLGMQTPEGEALTAELNPILRALVGETVSGQMVVLQQAERQLWISMSASPICTPDRRILGAVATLTDVTALRELQKNQEMYTHTISHDLRTPLTVIHGHAQMLEESLREKGFAEEAELHAAAIVTGADRMNSMIEDLVDAARLEGGDLPLDRRRFELRPYVEELLQRSAAGLDVDRVRAYIPAGLAVWADENRLERIFTNLLTNALKYGEAGSTVEVGASAQTGEVTVTVRDRGPGIAAADLPRIFDRFYRVQESRGKRGVGLGLFICRMLVEAHGGRIWAESTPGEGSTFFFTLPASGH